MTDLYTCDKCLSIYEVKNIAPMRGPQRKCVVCGKEMGNTVWKAQLIERNENHIEVQKSDIRFYEEGEDMDKGF